MFLWVGDGKVEAIDVGLLGTLAVVLVSIRDEMWGRGRSTQF